MLTERFSEALTYAEALHRSQTRKGNDIPYIAHLMAVTATVLEWGGDEDAAIAALLHDAVEDQGGERTALEIRRRFGDLVLHCTDSLTEDPAQKLPWLERKTAYLERLPRAGADAALITAADKLHNITATIRDVRAHGPHTLQRFNEPDRVVWYFRSVAEALEAYRTQAPIDELRQAAATLGSLLHSEVND
jgi:(p)ppGpp synthase/HD superfamily hydrolase